MENISSIEVVIVFAALTFFIKELKKLVKEIKKPPKEDS